MTTLQTQWSRAAGSHPAGAALDFSGYIAERSSGFTARGWVFEAIEEWLQDTKAPRHFLLTGEPGSGKTALAAWLVRMASEAPAQRALFPRERLFAAHFCLANDSSWSDPSSFAQSVSAQLSEHCAEFRRALVGSAPQPTYIDATLTANRIERGAVAASVLVNLSGPDPLGVFNHGVLKPLEALYAQGFGAPAFLIVDALDQALAPGRDVTIVDLVAQLEQAPAKIRLLLTSLPDQGVENRFPDARRLSLSSPENKHHWSDDMRRFVDSKVSQNVLMVGTEGAERFAAAATDRADGNFLYMVSLFAEIAKGDRSVNDVETLPDGLDELLYQSLARTVMRGGRDAWKEVSALVGVLSVAMESLSRQELAAVLDLKERAVWNLLGRVGQLLEEIEDPGSPDNARYRLYHHSFIDFLRKPRIKSSSLRNTYYLPAEEWHDRIARHFRGDAATWAVVKWAEMSDYGLRHIAAHLAGAGKSAELYELVSKPFLQQSWKRFRSPRQSHSTVSAALAIAQRADAPDLAQQVRLSLLHGMLVSRASRTPPEALGLLAELGGVREADDFVALLAGNPETQSRGYRSIGQAMAEKGDLVAARSAFEKAVAAAHRIATSSIRSEELSILAPALAHAGDSDAVKRLRPQIDLVGEMFAYTRFRRLAEAAAVSKDAATLRKLCRAALKRPKERRLLAAAEIAAGISAGGDSALALRLALRTSRAVERPPWTEAGIEAGCVLAKTLVAAGQRELAVNTARGAMLDCVRTYSPFTSGALPHVVEACAACRDSATLQILFAHVAMLRIPMWNFRRVAEAAHEIGDLDLFNRVVELLRSTVDHEAESERSADAMNAWARVLATAGDYEAVTALIEPAKAMSARWFGSNALEGVALALSTLGDHDRALVLALAISIEETRTAVRIEIARNIARAGLGERARSVLALALAPDDLRARQAKADALSRLALAYARAGRTFEACQFSGAAMAAGKDVLADRFSFWSIGPWPNLLSGAFAAAGDTNGLNDLIALIDEFGFASVKFGAFALMARRLAEAGVARFARKAALRALAARKPLRDDEQLGALAALATALAKLGRARLARAVANHALRHASAEKYPAGRAESQGLAAIALIEAGERDRAVQIAEATVKAANSEGIKLDQQLFGFDHQQRIFRYASEVFAKAGMTERALAAIAEIDHPFYRAQAFGPVGEAVVADKTSRDRLRQLAAGIETADDRAHALSDLACALAAAGRTQDATEIALEAYAAAARMGPDVGKVRGYVCASLALHAVGQPAEALAALQKALAEARLWNLQGVYDVLAECAPVLVAASDVSLWPALQAVADVDVWEFPVN